MAGISTEYQGQDCPVIRHVPLWKAGGDLETKEDAAYARAKFCQALNKMWCNPLVCSKACDSIQADIDGEILRASAGDGDFKKIPDTVGDLDNDWCVSFIVLKTDISAKTLGTACVYDGKTIGYVMQVLLNCSCASKLGETYRNKHACFSALSLQVAEAGGRGRWMTDEDFFG